jgi:hypothetical protein
MKSLTFVAALVAMLIGSSRAADTAPPAGAFDLQEWKLQIPGPLEVKQLAGYSSGYFHLNKNREMVFTLDAAEKGPTPNTKYVRSELRHLPNWRVDESHSLSAELKAVCRLDPDKVTVLQIHGIAEDGGDAPPLLRIALNGGDLFAMLKPGNEGERTDSILLKKGVATNWFKVEISVKNRRLLIAVDNQQKLSRSLAYWKYPNYFKAGCYPQAVQGTAEVSFRKLTVK